MDGISDQTMMPREAYRDMWKIGDFLIWGDPIEKNKMYDVIIFDRNLENVDDLIKAEKMLKNPGKLLLILADDKSEVIPKDIPLFSNDTIFAIPDKLPLLLRLMVKVPKQFNEGTDYWYLLFLKPPEGAKIEHRKSGRKKGKRKQRRKKV